MTELRPEELPEWGSDSGALIKAPSIEKRKKGYSIDSSTGIPDIPSLKGENWFRNLVYKWIKYFDSKISSLSLNIPNLTIRDEEKQAVENTWLDLNSFNVPKGKWLFYLTFRHTNLRTKQQNRFFSPIVVCGISEKKGSLFDFQKISSDTSDQTLIELSKNIKKYISTSDNLYFSNISKEVTMNIDGSFVENISFSCIIDAQSETTYYVKDLYLTYPYDELYRVYYQINAIKIG